MVDKTKKNLMRCRCKYCLEGSWASGLMELSDSATISDVIIKRNIYGDEGKKNRLQ